MAESRLRLAAALAVALLSTQPGAAEPGDLGRLPVEHWRGDRLSREDWGIFPTRGRLAVSEAEIDMHARLARFFDPAARQGWIARFQHVAHADAVARYRVLEEAVATDLDLLAGAFAAICAVAAIDAQREAAAYRLASEEAGLMRSVARRAAENAGHVRAFSAALAVRHRSYSAALDRLLVETPDRAARGVDDRIWELADWVEAAERGHFCVLPEAAPLSLPLPGGRAEALPSRVLGGAAGPNRK